MVLAIEDSGIPITTDTIKSKLLDMDEKVTMTGNRNRKNIVCYKCKTPGHLKSKYSNSDNDKRQNKTSDVFSAVFISGFFDRSNWYVDSGASAHLTENEEWMKNKVNDINMHKMMVENHTEIPFLRSVEVDLTTAVGKKSFYITVKNIVCAPGLTKNLLSVSGLIEKVIFFELNSDQCNIYNNHNELVATAVLINGVYKLKTDRGSDILEMSTA
ncbi:uncharacterized protein LOC126456674 [Schistocerca serialis cubense]|uniref:uncharacterized protein LOC126456674 n=1 Tax=Schistocerca serialis cubense TaxID=2023355 RepID=UPI00214E724C|nr:uncharacterized protein LOC126456674 [Schistocerca serialis cubense]